MVVGYVGLTGVLDMESREREREREKGTRGEKGGSTFIPLSTSARPHV